jgi:signal transduction histidine kinase
MTRILIIDDDFDVRDQVATILLADFYETYTAVDGQDGVNKALQRPPDLIICDMMMPNMSGQEVLAELRKHPETSTIPFIFLTAVDTRDTVRESMNLGADDYLFKPFQVSDLRRTVSARLKHHREILATGEARLETLKLRLARMITHELRTPLSFIVTSLDIISMPGIEMSSEETGEVVQTMRRGANRLSHCIEQLIYVTYLTMGTYLSGTMEERGVSTSVKDMVAKAITSAQQFTLHPAENVTWSVTMDSEDDLFVKCDPNAIKQALAELISNALAFSPPGGNVRISYKRIQHDIRITITDNGEGIPDDNLKEALSWFGQVNRDETEQQGMGLGLPLANQLIAIHNGSLDIRSVPRKGTQVVVTLPAEKAEA